MFSKIARWISLKLGDAKAFLLACLTVFIWAVTGPLFKFSDSWQLVINTGTTIVTFLMVFLIQNTQNRDTVALHLKLDEIIRSIHGAHNQLLKIEELTDEDLEMLHKRYEKLATKVQKRLKKGKDDTDTPNL